MRDSIRERNKEVDISESWILRAGILLGATV